MKITKETTMGQILDYDRGIGYVLMQAGMHCVGCPYAFLGVSLDQIFGVAPLTPEVTLSQEETVLLGMFRSLDITGKEMLMSTARAFAGNPDMQKEKSNTVTA